MASEQDLQYVGPDLGGHASAPELSRAQAIERDRAVLGLLRQLAGGLSSYRLFPGDLKQPTFVQAVQRIRHAAEAALAWGPFEAEINGKRFITPTGPAPSDEQTERFALVFYEHGAERLSLRGVPDARELGVLYEALSLPVGTKDSLAYKVGCLASLPNSARVSSMSGPAFRFRQWSRTTRSLWAGS